VSPSRRKRESVAMGRKTELQSRKWHETGVVNKRKLQGSKRWTLRLPQETNLADAVI
jgi:hypothetical protein